MSREYVERRKRQIQRDGGEKEILWSLTAGCWMLCDLKRGTGEPLTERPENQPGGEHNAV